MTIKIAFTQSIRALDVGEAIGRTGGMKARVVSVLAVVLQDRTHLVRLGGKNEVAFCQTFDLVGPDRDPDLAPAQVEFRMMLLFLSQLTHAVGEIQRFTKILEGESLFQVMFIDDVPIAPELLMQGLKGIAFQRGHSPPTRHTFLMS